MIRTILASALGLATIAGAANAQAAPADSWDPPRSLSSLSALSVVSTTVRLSDVDVRTETGAKTVARRIKNAASFVCSGGNDIIYQIADDYMPCRERTIDRALADLQAPLVSAALGRQPPVGVAAR